MSISKGVILRIYFSLFVFGSLWLGPASCVHLAEAPNASTSQEPAPFLWEVRKGGAAHWLFGTAHVGLDADRDLSAPVWKRFNESPCLVVETDTTAVDQKELLKMGQLPAGDQLSRRLERPIWQAVSARLAPMVPERSLDRMSPWLVTLFYMQSLVEDGSPAVDAVFLQRGRASKKDVAFLEDWRAAIDAFKVVTDAQDLKQLVEDEASMREQVATMLKAYRSGDALVLERVINDVTEHTPRGDEKNRVMIDARNRAWLPRLVKILTRGMDESQTKNGAPACFVAVGVGHLVGKNNLRTLLESDGFSVTRLTADGATKL